MSLVAFALRADYDDGTFAGTVALPNGATYDVREALDAGKGTIVTDDSDVTEALSLYPAVKTVAVPDSAKKGYKEPVTVDPALAGTSGEANEGIVPDDSPVPSGPAPTGSATTSAGTAKGGE